MKQQPASWRLFLCQCCHGKVQICWGLQGQPYIRYPHCSQMDTRLFPHNTHQIFWCKRFKGGFSFPQASYKQSRRRQTVSNHRRSLERGRARASVRTDGASAIAGGNKLRALAARASPECAVDTRCMLRGEVPASKQPIPDLTDVTTDVIATVNCIKTQHVKSFLILSPPSPCLLCTVQGNGPHPHGCFVSLQDLMAVTPECFIQLLRDEIPLFLAVLVKLGSISNIFLMNLIYRRRASHTFHIRQKRVENSQEKKV